MRRDRSGDGHHTNKRAPGTQHSQIPRAALLLQKHYVTRSSETSKPRKNHTPGRGASNGEGPRTNLLFSTAWVRLATGKIRDQQGDAAVVSDEICAAPPMARPV